MQPETWDLGGERVTVRRAHSADIGGLAALVGADPVSAARGDSGEGDLSDYEEAFAEIEADAHQLLVVVVREGPAGRDVPVATLQRTLIPGFARRGGRRAELEAVHVAEELRGHGLGARLVRWAVEDARRHGCILVQLTSSHERPAAHRFYERLGFTATHVGFKLALD